jgi:hypothetical protein
MFVLSRLRVSEFSHSQPKLTCQHNVTLGLAQLGSSVQCYVSWSSSALASFRSFVPEALGEPAIDGLEQVVGFPDPPLVAHEPCIAGHSAQLPGLRLLLARPVERGEVIALRLSVRGTSVSFPVSYSCGFSAQTTSCHCVTSGRRYVLLAHQGIVKTPSSSTVK